MVAADGKAGRGWDKQIVYMYRLWRKRNRIGKLSLYVVYGTSVMSAKMFEVSLLGVGTVLRLERDAWSMVK